MKINDASPGVNTSVWLRVRFDKVVGSIRENLICNALKWLNSNGMFYTLGSQIAMYGKLREAKINNIYLKCSVNEKVTFIEDILCSSLKIYYVNWII